MRAWLSRLPRHTLRFRITVLYGVLTLAASAGLLAITYALTSDNTSIVITNGSGGSVKPTASAGTSGVHEILHGTPTDAQLRLARQFAFQIAQRERDLHELLIGSGIALAIMVAIAVILGWVVAGRVLRPLRTMKAATDRITERNLHERLALPGPGDEVKDLADTIDGLLARLQAAFDAQQRFVASASHELRTPLTLNRALLEVALADPTAGEGDLRSTCEELLAAGEQQERLVEALLTLATTEHGLNRMEEFDLADTCRRALVAHCGQAERRGLHLDIDLGHAIVSGDEDLAERLAANLVDNAIRYNIPGGSVRVRTETEWGNAVLSVTNTGLRVPPDLVGQLFEPFRRLTDDRTSHPDGHGLGLSIVRSIATAHGADLDVQLPPGGGLAVRVLFHARAERKKSRYIE
jgi:signal transduction histidine kinase